MSKSVNTVLAIFPNPKGFGYALMQDALNVIDYGMVTISPICNRKILKRITSFLENDKPTTVVLENYRGRLSFKSKRIQKLIDKISKEANKRKIGVAKYAREQIRHVFSQFGAKNKYEISKVITENIPVLKPHLKPKRRCFEAESYTMGIFDAVALGITHYYLTD